MLAMDVNNNVGGLIPSGVFQSIVGTPPGACSLLQGVAGYYRQVANAASRRLATKSSCCA